VRRDDETMEAFVIRLIREDALKAEREAIAAQARLYASYYPQSSDGRNTFILLAEWIEARKSS
jgi:hypothetical protein